MFSKNNFLIVVIVFGLLPGCAMSPARQASLECGLKGAGLGLLGGAAAGALTSLATGTKMTTAVAIGAGAGAAVGGAAGAINCYMSASHQSETVQDYSVAKAAINYDTSQGNKVKIAELAISPMTVQAGGQVNIETNYYVMTPDENQDLVVTEQWTMERLQGIEKKEIVGKQVKKKKKSKKKSRIVTESANEEVINFIPIGEPSLEEQHIKPGKRKSTTNFPITADTPKGTYRLNLLVQYGGQSDKAQQEFTVQ